MKLVVRGLVVSWSLSRGSHGPRFQFLFLGSALSARCAPCPAFPVRVVLWSVVCGLSFVWPMICISDFSSCVLVVPGPPPLGPAVPHLCLTPKNTKQTHRTIFQSLTTTASSAFLRSAGGTKRTHDFRMSAFQFLPWCFPDFSSSPGRRPGWGRTFFTRTFLFGAPGTEEIKAAAP